MAPINISLAKAGEVKISGRRAQKVTETAIIARKAIDVVPYFGEAMARARENPGIPNEEVVRRAILADPTVAIITLFRSRRFKPKDIAALCGFNVANKDAKNEWTSLLNKVKWHFMCQIAGEFVEAHVPDGYTMDAPVREYGDIPVGISGKELREKCLKWLFKTPVLDELTRNNSQIAGQHVIKIKLVSKMRGIKVTVPGELYPWAFDEANTPTNQEDEVEEHEEDYEEDYEEELEEGAGFDDGDDGDDGDNEDNDIVAPSGRVIDSSEAKAESSFAYGNQKPSPAALAWIDYAKYCRREYRKVFNVKDNSSGNKEGGSLSMMQASAAKVVAHLVK